MLDMLESERATRHGVIAKLAGGANMFGGAGPIQIGASNYDAVLVSLAAHRIHVAGEHIGGDKGRRISFDSATGQLVVEVAGEMTLVI